MSELERLLALATTEPAQGPAFFRTLLSSDVFVLVPADCTIGPGAALPYVIWTDSDGVRVIPFFASRGAVRRALTRRTRAVRIDGRTFLESCRGATVVLNPNESHTFRLAPEELDRLVATGLPNTSERYVSQGDLVIVFRAPDVPANFLDSLRVLLEQHPGVQSAYLATMNSPLETSPVWLIAIRSDAAGDVDHFAAELSSVLASFPLGNTVDLMRIEPGSETDDNFHRVMQPFYEKTTSVRTSGTPSSRLH